MWKLIKAEIAYYRRSIVMMYLLIFPVTIAYVYFGGKEVSELLLDKWLVMGIWMMFLAALILYGFTKVESIRHKRDRYLSLRPLPIQKFAILRFILPIFYWLSMIILFWLIYFISSTGNIQFHFLWNFLYISGLFCCLIATRFIFNDLQHIRSGRKSKKLIIAIAVILIQVLFWPYFLTLYSYYNVKPFNFLKNDIPTFLLSHTSAIISAFAGLVCVGLSVVIFVKQKSYLE
jgi:hypothetical protein